MINVADDLSIGKGAVSTFNPAFDARPVYTHDK